VIGIDDLAWRRNQRYGIIVCDLERRCCRTRNRRPLRLGCKGNSKLQSSLAIVVAGYDLAISKAPRQAGQVADRLPLMENASSAFLDALRKSMQQIRGPIGVWRQSTPNCSPPQSGSRIRATSGRSDSEAKAQPMKAWPGS